MKSMNMFFTVCLLFFMVGVSAQSNVTSDDISIKVTRDGEKIVMECESGCAWKDLSFTLFSDQNAKYVDFFGVTSETKEIKDTTDDSYFLFAISRRDKAITLEAKKGMKWETLIFAPGGTVTRSGVRTSK